MQILRYMIVVRVWIIVMTVVICSYAYSRFNLHDSPRTSTYKENLAKFCGSGSAYDECGMGMGFKAGNPESEINWNPMHRW